ncbi:hypothetical protein QFC21_005914 [Naganishia friedmannii]|uniref:Uncharacterized protein n=1 Tax=Naganishia friedmannii TaxID=89922 RepID=A0ACC2V7E0_9TREE|nr:hypothetical protein QFC21_005914 [Naganishia friedmannii]
MAKNGAMPVQEEWNEGGGHDQLGTISLAYAIEQQEKRDLLQIKGDPRNESAYSYLYASILDWTKKEAEPSTTTASAITVVMEEVPDEFKDDVEGAECTRLKRQNTPDILFVWYNEKSRKNWPSTHIRIVTPLLDEDTDGRKHYRLTFSSGYQPGFSRLRCIMRIAQYNDLQVIKNLGKGNLQVDIEWYRWWSEKTVVDTEEAASVSLGRILHDKADLWASEAMKVDWVMNAPLQDMLIAICQVLFKAEYLACLKEFRSAKPEEQQAENDPSIAKDRAAASYTTGCHAETSRYCA